MVVVYKLFHLLLERHIPLPITRLILDMHIRQQIQATWMGCLSDEFGATNGVRQGGVLLPVIFIIYYDVLLQELTDAKSGCHIGHTFFDALSYATW